MEHHKILKKSLHVIDALVLIFIPLLLTSLSSCDRQTSRTPTLEIVGDDSWFKSYGTREDTLFFLENYKRDFDPITIAWPPNHRRRLLDISVDATGSCYWYKVKDQDKEMFLAEFNLRKLCEYLRSEKVLLPGDKIQLRVFGKSFGRNDAIGREFCSLDLPTQRLTLKGKILTRRYRDLQIIVRKVESPRKEVENIIDSIFTWYLPRISRGTVGTSERYKESPLLEYVKKVIDENRMKKSTQTIFIFVTDGFFQLDHLDFRPKKYKAEPNLPSKIKERIDELSLKPFNQQEPDMLITIRGLNNGGDLEFENAQKELLEYFFDPQPLQLKYH